MGPLTIGCISINKLEIKLNRYCPIQRYSPDPLQNFCIRVYEKVGHGDGSTMSSATWEPWGRGIHGGCRRQCLWLTCWNVRFWCSPMHQAAGGGAVQREQKRAIMLHLLPGWRHYQLKEYRKAQRAVAGGAVRLRSWKKEKTISVLPRVSPPVPAPHQLSTIPLSISPHFAPHPQVPLSSWLLRSLPSIHV